MFLFHIINRVFTQETTINEQQKNIKSLSVAMLRRNGFVCLINKINMKRFALLIFAAIVVINVNAQIGTTSVAAPQQKEQKPVFDSTQNFLGSTNVQSYVGQILYVKPKSLPEYGYEYFKRIDINTKHIYGSDSHYGSNSEKSEFNTKYEDLVGKYFKVDSILKRDYFSYIFYLTNTNDESDRCCFIYSSNYKHTFPFIVLSHFNYLRDTYVGKQYIIRGYWLSHTDIITGDSIKINDNSKVTWTVSELTVVDNYNKDLAFVVKNGNMTTYIDAERFENEYEPNGGRFYYEKDEWNSLVKKYGITMMKMVLDEEIKVGMPEKLLYYSWGKPERINTSSAGRKQYVYDKSYVYVKEGKVVSWQSYE